MNLLQKLIEKNNLTKEEAMAMMSQIMNGSCSTGQMAALLVALKMKGETREEIAAFAEVMRENARRIMPKVDRQRLVDTCGTGGDSSNTFNISTTAAFIAAGAEVKIAKHGNRSVSSSCGSADVLEQLGVKMLEPPNVETCIEKIGIGFMFAPYFHPAMKHVAPVRKELGVRTVFNILGPLTNPAGAQAQILGVFDPLLIPTMADALAKLSTKRALVVHSDGMDEIGLGRTKIAELKNGSVEEYELDGSEFGFKQTEIPKASSKEESARILLDVLHGKNDAAKDVATLNAAGAIYVGGMANSIEQGIGKASDSIDSGNALAKLEQMIKFGDVKNENCLLNLNQNLDKVEK
ncbi:Anthranilate phosphoribosyltransferase [Candidatus Bilamarchaeum dharawalense]|uniref:Anthranilate phosphoribosyltransferase n=1 Tax=Candidatus Bilamarchaeum dharawalense TaxID=2885759 RepID=A0A5E4LVL8_9ARCH|nr:Anthranilate phosphoribosyltransferase [Candidatus Bilamarchaeum dharawalense]